MSGNKAKGEKIGTALLSNYHSDLAGSNLGMKELRKAERLKKKTEKMISKAVEKKTGGKQDIVSWPPPQMPDAEAILTTQDQSEDGKPVEESKPEEEKPVENKVEFKKRKALPPGLAKRLAAKVSFSLKCSECTVKLRSIKCKKTIFFLAQSRRFTGIKRCRNRQTRK